MSNIYSRPYEETGKAYEDRRAKQALIDVLTSEMAKP